MTFLFQASARDGEDSEPAAPAAAPTPVRPPVVTHTKVFFSLYAIAAIIAGGVVLALWIAQAHSR